MFTTNNLSATGSATFKGLKLKGYHQPDPSGQCLGKAGHVTEVQSLCSGRCLQAKPDEGSLSSSGSSPQCTA